MLSKLPEIETREGMGWSTVAALALALPVVVTLALVLGYRGERDTARLQPIELITGEWPPYSGAQLPDHGLATAIVTRVMREIGYEPAYRFLPWGLAEPAAEAAEHNAGPRGAFPYYETPERARAFYIAAPALLAPPVTLFYRRDRPPDPAASLLDIARTHRYILLEGYRYTPEVEAAARLFPCGACAKRFRLQPDRRPPDGSQCACERGARAPGTREAFRRLLASDEPAVVPEALEVGRYVLRSQLRAEMRNIAWLDPRPEMQTPVHLIASRRNPHNKELMERFGAKLRELDARGELDALRARQGQDLVESTVVVIRPRAGGDVVWAEHAEGRFAIPAGVRARVMAWGDGFAPPATPGADLHVRVTLLDGPMAGAEAVLDGASVELTFASP